MRVRQQFCPHCEVTMDLHDGPDSCEAADSKARMLEVFDRMCGHSIGPLLPLPPRTTKGER